MKFGTEHIELDPIDRGILAILQENCRTPLAKIGDKVGLSAPSVVDRVKKLEDSGVVTGYHARIDGRKVGIDVTAFIGLSTTRPGAVDQIETEIGRIEGVLECHHVTGSYTLLLKVKTMNTSTLEALISRLRAVDGVSRTETMVVLSTHSETATIPLETQPRPAPEGRKPRRNGQGRTAA